MYILHRIVLFLMGTICVQLKVNCPLPLLETFIKLEDSLTETGIRPLLHIWVSTTQCCLAFY